MYNNTDLRNHPYDPIWLSRIELSFFVIINWIRIRRFVAVVLASWSLSSDNWEWNCAIGIVDGFNLLKWSSVTPSIEMYLKPEKYCEYIFHWVPDMFLHNHVYNWSQNYFVKSQACHVVHLHNDFSQGVNMWQMKRQFFNLWSVIFWMKIQNAAWF